MKDNTINFRVSGRYVLLIYICPDHPGSLFLVTSFCDGRYQGRIQTHKKLVSTHGKESAATMPPELRRLFLCEYQPNV